MALVLSTSWSPSAFSRLRTREVYERALQAGCTTSTETRSFSGAPKEVWLSMTSGTACLGPWRPTSRPTATRWWTCACTPRDRCSPRAGWTAWCVCGTSATPTSRLAVGASVVSSEEVQEHQHVRLRVQHHLLARWQADGDGGAHGPRQPVQLAYQHIRRV